MCRRVEAGKNTGLYRSIGWPRLSQAGCSTTEMNVEFKSSLSQVDGSAVPDQIGRARSVLRVSPAKVSVASLSYEQHRADHGSRIQTIIGTMPMRVPIGSREDRALLRLTRLRVNLPTSTGGAARDHLHGLCTVLQRPQSLKRPSLNCN